MIKYVVSTIIRSVITLFVVVIISFFTVKVAYRNPAVMLAPRNATQETIDSIATALNLNAPWYDQLRYYVIKGPEVEGVPMGLCNWPPSLGYSFRKHDAVTRLILSRVSVTFSLAVGAIIIWMTLSLVLGITAARWSGRFVDSLLACVSYLFLSLPTFLSGILISYFLFYELTKHGYYIFPSGGYTPFLKNPIEWSRHLILPWLTLALAEIGIFQRLVRAEILDVIGKDYIRTARAKGVSEMQIYFSHALSAALNPIITLGGLELAVIMGGAIVTETIFGLDGVGRLAVTAALDGDFPLVMGTTIFAAFVFVVSTLVTDVITYWRDPSGSSSGK